MGAPLRPSPTPRTQALLCWNSSTIPHHSCPHISQDLAGPQTRNGKILERPHKAEAGKWHATPLHTHLPKGRCTAGCVLQRTQPLSLSPAGSRRLLREPSTRHRTAAFCADWLRREGPPFRFLSLTRDAPSNRIPRSSGNRALSPPTFRKRHLKLWVGCFPRVWLRICDTCCKKRSASRNW